MSDPTDTTGDDTGADDGGDDEFVDELAVEAVCEYLAKAVVERPEAVDLEVDEDDDDVTLVVHVDPDDMGRVIGKRGRTANAIRSVVGAAAEYDHVRVDVEFAD